jgi:hypothetical protein
MIEFVAMDRYARKHPEIERPGAPEEDSRSRSRLVELWWAARQEFLRSGEPMLDWEGLEREIAERRGGVSEQD